MASLNLRVACLLFLRSSLSLSLSPAFSTWIDWITVKLGQKTAVPLHFEPHGLTWTSAKTVIHNIFFRWFCACDDCESHFSLKPRKFDPIRSTGSDSISILRSCCLSYWLTVLKPQSVKSFSFFPFCFSHSLSLSASHSLHISVRTILLNSMTQINCWLVVHCHRDRYSTSSENET